MWGIWEEDFIARIKMKLQHSLPDMLEQATSEQEARFNVKLREMERLSAGSMEPLFQVHFSSTPGLAPSVTHGFPSVRPSGQTFSLSPTPV